MQALPCASSYGRSCGPALQHTSVTLQPAPDASTRQAIAPRAAPEAARGIAAPFRLAALDSRCITPAMRGTLIDL
jgi:hypothetical protein